MGFIIRASEKSHDLHQPGCRKIGREKQGAADLARFQSFQPFKSLQMFNSDS
jgi:hypothetical protein